MSVGWGTALGWGSPRGAASARAQGRGSAGEPQGTGEEEGAHAWPVAGLGAACKRLGPNPTTLPALGGADE